LNEMGTLVVGEKASVRFAVTADTPDEIDLGDIRPGEKRHHSPPRGQGER